MKVIELNKEAFCTRVADIEKRPDEFRFLGDKPALVDFYATWCGPCRALAPVLEELAEEYAGRVDFYKVDTGRETELASAFGIRSIPTLLFFPLEGDPRMAQGALPRATLQRALDKMLATEQV